MAGWTYLVSAKRETLQNTGAVRTRAGRPTSSAYTYYYPLLSWDLLIPPCNESTGVDELGCNPLKKPKKKNAKNTKKKAM